MGKYEILKAFDNTLMKIEDILGDKTTNNLQLYKLGKILFAERFKGVFCSDDNITLKNNEVCILNTDPHNKPGLHWLALYRYINVYYVFDPFGRNVKKHSLNTSNIKSGATSNSIE